MPSSWTSTVVRVSLSLHACEGETLRYFALVSFICKPNILPSLSNAWNSSLRAEAPDSTEQCHLHSKQLGPPIYCSPLNLNILYCPV